jgi:hypothetical protein
MPRMRTWEIEELEGTTLFIALESAKTDVGFS